MLRVSARSVLALRAAAGAAASARVSWNVSPPTSLLSLSLSLSLPSPPTYTLHATRPHLASPRLTSRAPQVALAHARALPHILAPPLAPPYAQAPPPPFSILHRGFVTSGASGDGGGDDDSGNGNGNGNGDDKRGPSRRRGRRAAGAEEEAKKEKEEEKEKEKEKKKEATAEDAVEAPADEREVMMHSSSDTASAADELMGPPVIPESVPEVVVIPVTRNPIFPKFLKVVEISDPKLISKIKHRVRTGHPYAGAFLRKDEDA